MFASPTTWYRLVRDHEWRRPRQRVHPANHILQLVDRVLVASVQAPMVVSEHARYGDHGSEAGGLLYRVSTTLTCRIRRFVDKHPMRCTWESEVRSRGSLRPRGLPHATHEWRPIAHRPARYVRKRSRSLADRNERLLASIRQVSGRAQPTQRPTRIEMNSSELLRNSGARPFRNSILSVTRTRAENSRMSW